MKHDDKTEYFESPFGRYVAVESGDLAVRVALDDPKDFVAVQPHVARQLGQALIAAAQRAISPRFEGTLEGNDVGIRVSSYGMAPCLWLTIYGEYGNNPNMDRETNCHITTEQARRLADALYRMCDSMEEE